VSRVSLAEKLAAIVRRDVLTTVRYRNGFVLAAVGVGAEIVAFFYLARAIGPGFRPEGVDYFPFLVVGSGFYTFLITGVQAFLSTVQEAQQTGTLEVLLTTATPAPVLIFLSAFSAFAGKLANLVLFLGAGLWLFRVPLLHPNPVGAGLVFLLSLGAALAFGIFAAALQIAVQKGSAVIWLLGSVWFLTGALFPIGALPLPLRWAAWCIPVTHSLTGMRGALLLGRSTAELAPEILWLSAALIVLLPSSLGFFSWVLRRGRREGTLSAY
jgi:ABC-type polysaccharide/polyol phosphate export permease